MLNPCFLALKHKGRGVGGPSLCDLLDQRQSPLSAWRQVPKLQQEAKAWGELAKSKMLGMP